MTPKQKSIFELVSKYVASRGCEYLEMDIDPWNYRPYNGRNFGCGTNEYEITQKLPFDISETIREYANENVSDVDEDELNSMNFRLYPNTRTVTLSGTYQSIVDGPESELEKHAEDDEMLKGIMDDLENKGLYPYGEVDFSGGGDSGYIDDQISVHSGSKESLNLHDFQELQNYLYEMLMNYGGWENDEGAFGSFTIDTRRGTITLKFTWNEYQYEDVVFNEEKF